MGTNQRGRGRGRGAGRGGGKGGGGGGGRDSDSDGDVALRRQALPVDDGGGSDGDDGNEHGGPPVSAAAYLRDVRRQARKAPAVATAPPPPLEPAARGAALFAEASAAVAPAMPANLQPPPEWITALVATTHRMRSALARRRRAVPQRQQRSQIPQIPQIPQMPSIAAPAAAWRAFCYGPAPPSRSPARPALSVVCRLSHGAALALVQMHAEWIDEDRAGALPNPPMAEWLFALLVRIDVLLTADETATLRALAAACMRARQRIALDPGADPADLRMAASSMVVAIVHHVFGQRDLE